MTNDNVLRKLLHSTIAGGVAAGAGRSILGSLGTIITTTAGGGALLISSAPLVAGVSAAVAIGSVVSSLLDD